MRTFSPDPYLKPESPIDPYFSTERGAVFSLDCLDFLRGIQNEVVDTIFADPPFNLGKVYGANSVDDMPDEAYLKWCREWIQEATRTLKPGGSFFLYNLPKWNIHLGRYLGEAGLDFRHWIAVNIKSSMPIQGRLYPSHYSLLYYTKGKPNHFGRIRTPFELCRHCKHEIKDYGGHRNKMNPNGVNLTDVWNDITPVRHSKYKTSLRKANALSTRLLERVLKISAEPGCIVIDPFGGSGTTAAVCEWLDINFMISDIDSAPVIKERISTDLLINPGNDYIEDKKWN